MMLVFFLEYLYTSLKSPEEVEKCLNLPALASIPTIHSKQTNGTLTIFKQSPHSRKAYSGKLLSDIKPKQLSHIYEAYRTLKVNFAVTKTEGRMKSDSILKSILITSPGIAEGKTLTAINMAQTFAMSGVRTLLIDTDLRRPMVHRVLGIKKQPGLTDIFLTNHNMSINDVADGTVTRLIPTNLFVLPSGNLPVNPSEILMSRRMADLLSMFKSEYDLVILDSTPVIAVTDAVILGTQVDGVCMVIRSGKTRKDAALKAKQLLENSRSNIIGTIINDIDLQSVYRYYKYFYYYSRNGQDENNS